MPTLAAALLTGGVAYGTAEIAVEQRRAALENELRGRAATLAEANAALIAGRIAGLAQVARRITGSDLVQVYAAGARSESEPAGWLADQSPFLEQLLEDFVIQHDLLAASLVAPNGDVLLTVGDVPKAPASPERVGRGRDLLVSPIYELTGGATVQGVSAFDVVLPVPAATEFGSRARDDALLVMTLRARPSLAGLLPGGAAGDGPGGAVLAQAMGPGLRLPLGEPSERAGDAPGPASREVVRAEVAGTPWTLEQPVAPAEPAIEAYRRQALMLATAATLLLTLCFALYRRSVVRSRQRQQAEVEAAETERARTVGLMFENLAGAVSDGIGLKGADGRYMYANRSLAERFGRSVEELVGRTDAELLAEPGRPEDPGALPATLPALIEARRLGPEGDLPDLVLVVAPGLAPAAVGPAQGRASVPATRPDHLSIDQAVSLLARTVELRDPFLSGHAARVADLAAAVARRLGLSEAERTTIELAARLSQLGKIFIPDAILTKPGRHTEEETRIMRDHVRRGLDVLERIEFGLPVAFAFAQMYERLDGSGYPEGLAGDDVGLAGRILGAVDVFCARTAPRAYRDQVGAGQALFHLAGQPERYDGRVVKALIAEVTEARQRPAAPALPPLASDARTATAA